MKKLTLTALCLSFSIGSLGTAFATPATSYRGVPFDTTYSTLKRANLCSWKAEESRNPKLAVIYRCDNFNLPHNSANLTAEAIFIHQKFTTIAIAVPSSLAHEEEAEVGHQYGTGKPKYDGRGRSYNQGSIVFVDNADRIGRDKKDFSLMEYNSPNIVENNKPLPGDNI